MDTKLEKGKLVNIRPGVSILSVLQHLKYTYWYALAEFVDNSIQSYLSNREAIERLSGKRAILTIYINIEESDGGSIEIRDNAAGILREDFSRAFKPAETPMDRSGLSEFGMGLKSAACWCGNTWSVTTKHFLDQYESKISFDVPQIVKNSIEELAVDSIPGIKDSHYTKIFISGLHKIPRAGAIARIREHLADIYRNFIREGSVVIKVNDDPLVFEDPEVLEAPQYDNKNGPALLWKKDIDFDFGSGMHVKGFVGIRAKGNTSTAGFSLFRRGRVIEGSGDDPYRPELIFGKGNSYASQRLFGELNLDGFSVTHTKDGFLWDENEEPFLELLKEQLDSPELPILKQVEHFRSRKKKKEVGPAAIAANESVVHDAQIDLPPVITALENHPVSDTVDSNLVSTGKSEDELSKRNIVFTSNNTKWDVTLELTNDPIGDWCEIAQNRSIEGRTRSLHVRMSVANPFVIQFSGANHEHLEAMWRVVVALAVSETIAIESSGRAAAVRRNMNEILRTALSKGDPK